VFSNPNPKPVREINNQPNVNGSSGGTSVTLPNFECEVDPQDNNESNRNSEISECC